VLKPGAAAVITFSDHWFPTKAIELWTELHPFEHMGLVLEYFRQAGSFAALHSESLRGLPHPKDDKYAGQLTYPDQCSRSGVTLKHEYSKLAQGLQWP